MIKLSDHLILCGLGITVSDNALKNVHDTIIFA